MVPHLLNFKLFAICSIPKEASIIMAVMVIIINIRNQTNKNFRIIIIIIKFKLNFDEL